MNRNCSDCEFYDRIAVEYGRCRRFPPSWPEVWAKDWCGEFKKKEREEDD